MELDDRVEQISATISELREAAADGRKSRQLIDSLFRTVHSFKAAASVADRNELSSTAHEFENLLHSVRTGQVALNEKTLEAFDRAASALRDGSSPVNLPKITNEPPKSEDLLPPEFATLKDDERHRAAEALREGSNLYVLKAVFKISDFDERFRQLKEHLEQNAELISTSASMEDTQIVFQVFYASQSEKIPVQNVLQQAVRAGESAATKLSKQVSFVMTSEEFLLNRQWADVLTDALVHLVRNAVDHGIESRGTVVIDAKPGQFTVTDDGGGIAPENLPVIFQPGFSTTKDVTEFSGRGVGLDVVKTAIEDLGGSVSVTSEPGKGSSFKIRMPNPSSDA